MDSFGITASICVGVITVLITIYITIYKHLKNKANFRIIAEQAKKSGCKITEFEKESHFIIGIDHNSHDVFFTDLESHAHTHIHLADIKTCLVNQVTHTAGSGKSKITAIDRIELVFVCRDTKTADIVLECYDFDKSAQIGHQITMLNKWSAKINDELVKMKRQD